MLHPEAVIVLAKRDDLAAVKQAVKNGGGERLIAQEAAPFIRPFVRRKDKSRMVIPFINELEEQVGFLGIDGHIHDVVDDDEL